MTTTENEEDRDKAAMDRWHRFVTTEIPEEKRRLREMKDVTTGRLHSELHGTVLELVHDLAKMVLEVSGSTGQWLGGLTDHVEEIDGRLSGVEDLLSGDDTTQLSAEHAEKLMTLATSTKVLVKWLIENASLPDDTKKKLAEHAVLAAECETIIAAAAPDDDEDEDQDEADEQKPAS